MKKFLNANYGYVIVAVALIYLIGALLIELHYRKKENELESELMRLQIEKLNIERKLNLYN